MDHTQFMILSESIIQDDGDGMLHRFISSPEHEVLMVSYCDQSMPVVRRQQFVLKANSSWTLGPMWFKLHRNVT